MSIFWAWKIWYRISRSSKSRPVCFRRAVCAVFVLFVELIPIYTRRRSHDLFEHFTEMHVIIVSDRFCRFLHATLCQRKLVCRIFESLPEYIIPYRAFVIHGKNSSEIGARNIQKSRDITGGYIGKQVWIYITYGLAIIVKGSPLWNRRFGNVVFFMIPHQLHQKSHHIKRGIGILMPLK